MQMEDPERSPPARGDLSFPPPDSRASSSPATLAEGGGPALVLGVWVSPLLPVLTSLFHLWDWDALHDRDIFDLSVRARSVLAECADAQRGGHP